MTPPPNDTPPTSRTYRNSVSTLTAHRKCPQAWAYREIHELIPAHTGPVVRRDLGSWWHALRAADSIRRGIAKRTLRHVPETLNLGDGTPRPLIAVHGRSEEGIITSVSLGVPEWKIRSESSSAGFILDAAEAFWNSLSAENREAWQVVIGEQTLAQHLSAMHYRWWGRWRNDLADEAPLGVEVQWTRHISADPWSDPQPLQGMVDEVYLDTKRQMVVVRDHKTSVTLAPSETVDNLLDAQLHLYAWGVSPTVKKWGDLPKIGAISYDRARSKPPTAPALTQMGSLSKATSDYDLETYLAFTGAPVEFPGRKKDGSQAGAYARDPEVVTRLTSLTERQKWNSRTLAPVNINVVRSHLRAARETWRRMMEDVATFEKEGEVERNFTRMGCGMCDFREICLAEVLGGPGGEFDPGDYGLKHEAPRS